MIPKKIYHYTTHEGAQLIVGNQELWLTHYKDVRDDKNEFLYGLTRVDKAFKKRFIKKRNDFFAKTFLRNPAQMLEQDPLYIACFCGRDDNAHLWDTYTGNSGVCIEIDTDELGKHLIIYENTRICQMTNVDYNIDAFEEELKEVLSRLLYPDVSKHAKNMTQYLKDNPHNRNVILAILDADPVYYNYRETLSRLTVKGMFQKNPFYKSEEEIRIISGVPVGSQTLQHFTAAGKRRVKIPLHANGQSFITSVKNRAGEEIVF